MYVLCSLTTTQNSPSSPNIPKPLSSHLTPHPKSPLRGYHHPNFCAALFTTDMLAFWAPVEAVLSSKITWEPHVYSNVAAPAQTIQILVFSELPSGPQENQSWNFIVTLSLAPHEGITGMKWTLTTVYRGYALLCIKSRKWQGPFRKSQCHKHPKGP